MDKPEGSVLLQTSHDNGNLYHRLEMEQQLREKIETVHERRLLAIDPFGLEHKVAYDMKPVTVTHWILDEMIRRGLINGEEIGVGSTLGSDNHPESFKQFGQRLALFIENGWAVSPHKAEGIDMSKYPPAPPVGVPPNGQTAPAAYAPPAPPVGPPAGPPAAYAPPAPPAPATAPPAAYAPPAPAAYAPAPTPGHVAPPAYAPPGPPAPPAAPAVHAPPAPPMAPVAAAPAPYAPPAMAVPPTAPPVAAAATPVSMSDPGPPPVRADPQRLWGKASPTRTAAQTRPRRDKAEQDEDARYKVWKEQCKAMGLKSDEVEARYAAAPAQAAPAVAVPPTAPPGPPAAAAPPAVAPPVAAPPAAMAPPNPMTMRQGVPAAPPATEPIAAAPPAMAHGTSSSTEQILENQRLIIQHLKCLDVATAIALRNVYKTQGEFSCAAILTEFNIPLPQ